MPPRKKKRGSGVTKEYVVEKILGKKTSGKKPYYHIKWENYTDEYNTWEPEENLSPKLLVQYNEVPKSKPKKEGNDTGRKSVNEFGRNLIRMIGVVSYEAPTKPAHQKNQDHLAGSSQNNTDEYLFLCKPSATNQAHQKVPIKEAEEKYNHHVLEYFKEEVENLKQRNNRLEQEIAQATSPCVSLNTTATADYLGTAGTDEQDSFTSVDPQGAVDINISSSVSKPSSACNSTCLILILAHLVCSSVLIMMYLFPDRTWTAVGEMIVEIICYLASVIKSWPETLVNSVNSVE